jgi:cell division protein FtsA
MKLKITEAEAENLKKEHGSAIIRDEDKGEKIKLDKDGLTKEIEMTDLNAIVEARIVEITENVIARIKDVTEPYSLGNGIVIAGGASQLANLSNMMLDRYKINVRFSPIRNRLVTGGNEEIIRNPLYRTAISIMLKGSEQCVEMPEPEIPVIETVLDPDQMNEPDPDLNPITAETGSRNGRRRRQGKKEGEDEPKKLSRLERIKERFSGMKNIFEE